MVIAFSAHAGPLSDYSSAGNLGTQASVSLKSLGLCRIQQVEFQSKAFISVCVNWCVCVCVGESETRNRLETLIVMLCCLQLW